jgi:hypothetical protein
MLREGVVDLAGPLRRQVFEAAVLVAFDVEAVLDAVGTGCWGRYSENSMGMELMRVRMDSGSSSSARTASGSSLVLASFW